ncbi:MAG: 6-bladed beta-propeller [Gemmatimonadota bacterium]
MGFLLSILLWIAGCTPRPEASEEVVPFSQVFEEEQRTLLVTAKDDPLGKVNGVARWDGRIALTDEYGMNVKVFDPDGSLAMTLGRPGDGPGEFRAPIGAAVVTGDRLAVADYLRTRVIFFDPDGSAAGEFKIPGAAIGGLMSVEGGSALLLSARLVADDGRDASPYALHVLDLDGRVRTSLAERPTPRSITEGVFHQMVFGLGGDSLVLWGTIGRPDIVRGGWRGEVLDSVHVRGIREPDWGRAPVQPEEINEWTVDNLTWLMGIVAVEGGYIVRFQGGDARRGKEWQQYALLDEFFRKQVLTEPTSAIIIGEDGAGGVLGISFDEDGDAYLSDYSVHLPPFP